MAEITASQVKELRECTGAGMMECKKALVEADGNLDSAVDILRTRGLASLAKKAGRATNEGTIAAFVAPDSKVGVLVEVNCETDFVGMQRRVHRLRCRDRRAHRRRGTGRRREPARADHLCARHHHLRAVRREGLQARREHGCRPFRPRGDRRQRRFRHLHSRWRQDRHSRVVRVQQRRDGVEA